MQTVASSLYPSEPRVQQHFDRAAALYVDHHLTVYQRSVAQRMDMILDSGRFVESDPIRILDIGCGGGAFLDLFLDRFPRAKGTGIDLSRSMLERNRPSERKTLLQHDALNLPENFGDFDVISVDTVMHHLIARRGYRATQKRIGSFLRSLDRHLKPGGVIVVREIYHEYRMFESFGSRLIFAATTVPVPRIIENTMRLAGLQTANVGVCFQTRGQWQQHFSRAGLSVAAGQDCVWPGQPYRRYGFKQSGDLHYLLTRLRPAV